MEGLSIEEKAKRYDKALEKARQLCAYPTSKPFISDLQDLFPELAEPEDEKIRKSLAAYFAKFKPNDMWDADFSFGDIVAWFEKQGKNNMGISEATKQELEDNLNKALEKETPESWNKFLDEQGEQKPADKNESRQEELTEFEKAVKQVIEEAIECGDTHNLKADSDMLLRLVQKSSWSKENEEMVEDIIEAIDTQYAVTDYNEMVSWLKSLKDRYVWKPSDEQMDALNDVISSRDIKYDVLSELWKDLKKLKDEK